MRGLRAVVVLALGGVGYALFIPQGHADRKLLGNLVIRHTALKSVPAEAKLKQAIPGSDSTFSVTKRAARQHPDETGLYAREWYVAPGAPPEVGAVLQKLPTADEARRVLSAVRAQLRTAPTLSTEKASSPQSFSVPGVPSAAGVSFLLFDANTHAQVGTAYTAAYQVDDAVMSELIVSTSSTRDTAAAVADVQAGAALLRQKAPSFSMVVTTYPSTATLVYAVVTVVVATASLFLPEFMAERLRRRRQRHHEREQRKAREQYLARGRRTVRRGRAPAWSQSRKR
ncbi:MAG TPA: hypothetical protein DCQ30_05535 [Acidimicrobiaceae bacterium]|nr:hypothetical protein [Acidimicrobiaceae bacterium]